MMFGKMKERRREEMEMEKEDKEFEAKMTIKQSRKGVEAFLKEAATSVEALSVQALEAKKKGYEAPYRLLLGQLRIAESRRRQAEAFLFQLDAMSEADKLAKSSGTLLQSMNSIMGAMGVLSFDKNAILESQKIFAKSSQNLEKQSDMLEQVMMGMDLNVEMAGTAAVSEAEIELSLLKRLGGAKRGDTLESAVASSSATDTSSASSPASVDKEIAEMRRMVNKN